MATIRDKLGQCGFGAGNNGASWVSAPVQQGHPGCPWSLGGAFAVGRQSRTDFAFGRSTAMSGNGAEGPEQQAL
jgi:hypothetical protein